MEPLSQIRRLPKCKRKSPFPSFQNHSGRALRSASTNPIMRPVRDLRTRRVFSHGPAHIDKISDDSKCSSHLEDQNEKDEVNVGDLNVEKKQLQRNNSTNKMVTNIRRTKLFIAPGSFRYKKLLPCLKDIKPDQTSVLNIDADRVLNSQHLNSDVEQMKLPNSSEKRVSTMRPTKVVKAPGLFSYRRFLPFLEDTTRDLNAPSEIEIVNEKYPSNFKNMNFASCDQDSSNMALNEQYVTENFTGVRCKGICERSDDENIVCAESHKLKVQPITEQDISGVVNDYVDPVFGLMNYENFKNYFDDLTRGNVLMSTPGQDLQLLLNNQVDTSFGDDILYNGNSKNDLSRLTGVDVSRDDYVQAIFQQVLSGVVDKGSDTEFGDRVLNNGSVSDRYSLTEVNDLLNNGSVRNDRDGLTGGNDLPNNGSVPNDFDGLTGVNDLQNNGSVRNDRDGLTGVIDLMNSGSMRNDRDGLTGGNDLPNNGSVRNDRDGLTGVNDLINNGSLRNDWDGLTGVNDLINNGSVRNDRDVLTGVNDLLNNGTVRNDRDGLLGVNDLHEESVQMTPPDSEIFTTPKTGGYFDNIESKGCITKSTFPFHTPDDIISTNEVGNVNTFSLSPNQSIVTPSKMEMVLNPCSRQRVFKLSGSFSYRRLLPYLTSVATTNTCDSMVLTETPKMEQGREQQPRLLDSSKEGSSMNHLSPESSPKIQRTGENKHNEAVADVLTPTPDVSLLKSNCGSNYTAQLLSSVTSTNINGHLNALDTKNEEPLQTVNAKPNFLLKLNPDHSLGKIDSGFQAAFLCSKINQNTLLAESIMVPPNELNETAQDSMHVDNEQLVGTIVTKESPSKEFILKTRNHVNSSERGILKRNHRGCRGLCDCLHHASFRLHAERSFCFSRNQLQEAEEVAFNLMNELSRLRRMLDSSTADVTDPIVVHLNQLQVKEACRKALEAEKVAKERLNELNEDLNHHCRTEVTSLQNRKFEPTAYDISCKKQRN